jgi:hypothetical protein
MNWRALFWVLAFIAIGSVLLAPLALTYFRHKYGESDVDPRLRVGALQILIAVLVVTPLLILVVSPILFPGSALGSLIGGGRLELVMLLLALVVLPITTRLLRVIRRHRRPPSAQPIPKSQGDV